MESALVVLSSMFLIVMLGGALYGFLVDWRDYNRGTCRMCSGKWRLVDFDSQGGRLYRCDECSEYIWISWPVDLSEKEEE